jgi:hypothetical protein
MVGTYICPLSHMCKCVLIRMTLEQLVLSALLKGTSTDFYGRSRCTWSVTLFLIMATGLTGILDFRKLIMLLVNSSRKDSRKLILLGENSHEKVRP